MKNFQFLRLLTTPILFYWLFVPVSGVYTNDKEIVTATASFWNKGKVRYYYHDSHKEAPCQNWILLGVGTAMSVDDYSRLSRAIVRHNPDWAVLVLDPNPYVPIKLLSFQYKALVNHLSHSSNETLFPACSAPPSQIVIGGHSAAGRAAMVRGGYDFEPAAQVGLDPWWICPESSNQAPGLRSSAFCAGRSASPMIDETLPSLFFGFTQTTCGVDPSIASVSAYTRTGPDHHVLYQVHNDNTAPSTTYNHCSFTDHGCPGVYVGGQAVGCPMPKMETFENTVYDLVGRAFQRFDTAIRDPSLFHRQHFELFLPNVTFLVDGDLPALISES
jgi:hypothetical protein